MNKSSVIIGYSGHAYVIIDALYSSDGKNIFTSYCDAEEKIHNPYQLNYLGEESKEIIGKYNWFVGIGNNLIREKIISKFDHQNLLTIIHKTSIVSDKAMIGKGSFVSGNSTINALANIGLGCIINTGTIIEHECHIGDFAHIAPGAVLAGNVSIGKRSFIGANATVIQGINIGNDVVVGAGAVIINDIPDKCTVVGNPGKIIKQTK
ncbi:acetyltransferase [Portibacter lacus]|uniref:Acetyltransferase n=1 Tax=Portibacter lacus TaxID=1099794 RepID=A0AA37WHJ5_9BACT|nr:acetyltransferase [Portibacter lacus]GLR18870.1 acetyltransferase [Portibacter lacus]